MKLNKNIVIKTLFLFVILFALAFSVSADIDMATGTTDLGDITDGSSGVGAFTVDNTATSGDPLTSIRFDIGEGFSTAIDQAKITTLTFVPASIASLAHDDALETVDFTVAVPTKAYAGTYSGDIKTYTTDPAFDDTETFTFTVPQRHEVVVSGNKIILEDMLTGLESSDDFIIVSNSNAATSIISITAPASIKDSDDHSLALTGVLSFSAVTEPITYGGSTTITATLTGVPANQPIGTYGTGELADGAITITYGNSQTLQVPLQIELQKPTESLDIPEELDLGGSSQKRNEIISTMFPILNDGDETITEITVSALNVGEDYEIKFKKEDDAEYGDLIGEFTLAPGYSENINVQIFIPEDQDSGVKDIGDIVIESAELGKNTITQFELETRTMLEIEDNEISVTFDSPDEFGDETEFGDGGTIGGVLPGSELVFTVGIDNLFSESLDSEKELEMKSVKVEITLKDVNDNKDMDKKDSLGTIDAGDNEETDIKFTLPKKINEKEDGYEVIIDVWGTDKNRAEHRFQWTATLEIEKEENFIEITKFRFMDAVVEKGNTARLEFEILNMGQEKEEEPAVFIECKSLGITKIYDKNDIPKLRDNLLGSKADYETTFTFEVEDSYKVGEHSCVMKSYYNSDDESDRAETKLTIKESTSQSSTTDTTSTTTDTTSTTTDQYVPSTSTGDQTSQTTDSTQTGIQGQVVIGDQGFSDSIGYTVLLVIVGVLLLAILVLLVIKFFV
tara:strand:+ start:11216 stop:13426 length:2211 start_codon:yes stop_codon:yes gene_type:complete